MRAGLAIFAVATLLLAGCSSAPKGTRIDRIEVLAIQDDWDCDGVLDIFMDLRAVSNDSRLPVPFDGHLDAVLSRLVADTTYTQVDNWSADLSVDKFSPDGTINWFEQGQKLSPGHYRLVASARVNDEGTFTAQSELDFRSLGLALAPRAC